MKIRSKLFENEVVYNREKHAAADRFYYPAYVRKHDGTYVPAMFTDSDIERAIERASKNPEDVPERSFWWF